MRISDWSSDVCSSDLAIAALARQEATDLGAAYGGEMPVFGAEYLIPRPFDPRLLVKLAPAVAQAAMDSGVAARPIEDMAAYREKLSQHVFRYGLLVTPVFEQARTSLQRRADAAIRRTRCRGRGDVKGG